MKKHLVNYGKLINTMVMLSLLASSVIPVQTAQASKARTTEPPYSVADPVLGSPEAGNDLSTGSSPAFKRPSFQRPEPVKATGETQVILEETPTSDPSASPTEIPSVESSATNTAEPTASSPAPTAITYPAVPQEQISNSEMLFVKNVGQFDKRARFVVQGANSAIQAADDAIWLTYLEPSNITESSTEQLPGMSPAFGPESKVQGGSQGVRNGVNLRFHFMGGNPKPEIEGINPQTSTISYILGNDPSHWYPNVPSFTGIVYKDLYPGVNLEMTSEDGNWNWAFILADPSQLAANKKATLTQGIRIHFDGPDTVTLDEGMLHILTPLREFILPVPEVQMASKGLGMVANGQELFALGEPYVDGKELIFPFIMPTETVTPTVTLSETPTETITATPTPTDTPR
jgi:hypothetical protein